MLAHVAILLVVSLKCISAHVITDVVMDGAGVEESNRLVYHVSDDCECQTDPAEGLHCYGVKCLPIPGNLSVPSGRLRITGASLSSLTSHQLAGYEDLVELRLDSNEIISIEEGTFANLSKLVNLSLSYNKLSALMPGVFTGLSSLEFLRLTKNEFSSLANVSSALGPSVLPSLKHLILDDNGFGRINADDFKSLEGSALQILQLGNCDLKYIQYSAFEPLRQLRSLDLRENTIPESMLRHLLFMLKSSSVQSLDISRTGFAGSTSKQLFEPIANSNITDLRLGFNSLPRLSVKTFPDKMTKVQHLDLQQCGIIAIENGTFRGFSRLKTLNLAENTLLKVPEAVLLPQLEHLSLKDNSDNHAAGGQFEIRENIFSSMNQLQFLDLSLNRIGRLTRRTFAGLTNLRLLNLTRSQLYRIEKGSFESLSSLTRLYIAWNNLENEKLTKEHLRGLVNLQELDLSFSKITGFGEEAIFTETPNLMYLNLMNNRIKALSPNPFSNAPNLGSIDLTDNLIRAWVTHTFNSTPKLQILRLRKNRISTVTQVMVEDFQALAEVDLKENPFDCDCQMEVLLLYLKPDHKGNVSINIDHCISPDEWREKLVVDFLDNFPVQLCNATMEESITVRKYSIAITALYICIPFLVVLTIFGLALYRFRWYIRYWFFLFRMRRAHAKNPFVARDDFQYDAFVSYSTEDHTFVVRLINLLENQAPHFKLCVFERDFTAGTVLNECILQSIAASRKVVLVVSENFVRSQWCLWELHLAQHRLLEERREGLILIKLGPVKNSSISPTLRYLMRTRIYLEWDPDPLKQRLFWARLRSALARPSKVFEMPQTL